ncbi:hypothetical protein KR038_003231 [Drosophila bunnanda]|nr:hypothetical protein KR038_003231 [Drosophila bunnanda]
MLPMFMTLWLGVCVVHHPFNFLRQRNKVFPLPDPEDSGIILAQIGSPLDPDDPLRDAYDEFITTGAKEVGADLDVTDKDQVRQRNGTLEDRKILGSALFKADRVEALYNNRWGYAAPHSLGLVMNSLAVGFVGPGSGIRAEMETLPF